MATAARPLGDDPRDQKRREIRIASKYRRGFGTRVFVEMLWGIAAWLGVIAFAMSGVLPYAVACLINGWIAYLMYMPLHESTHGNVHGDRAELRFIDDIVGHASSIPLWFGFASHRISHMQHHAHTNTPGADPDFFLAGPLSALPMKFAIFSTLPTMSALLRLFPNGMELLPAGLREIARQSRDQRSAQENSHLDRFERSMFAAFLALSLAGFFTEALFLWWLPSRIGLFLVALLFGWLPHHPHAERGRYRDTRITLFPGSRLLIRGQDRHLLHHMFPRVPHYRLPQLFTEMRPILEAQAARIEGSLAGPGAPPVLLRSPAEATHD